MGFGHSGLPPPFEQEFVKNSNLGSGNEHDVLLLPSTGVQPFCLSGLALVVISQAVGHPPGGQT